MYDITNLIVQMVLIKTQLKIILIGIKSKLNLRDNLSKYLKLLFYKNDQKIQYKKEMLLIIKHHLS